MKKKYLLFLIIGLALFTRQTKASHINSGEIWYKYIGDSQHPHRYQVYLGIYRDVSGILLCYGSNCSQPVCVTSSCYPNMNLWLDQIKFDSTNTGGDTLLGANGSIITPQSTECTGNIPGVIHTEYYLFGGIVDLPGTCSDFIFSFSTSSRNASNNLLYTGNLYIQATLNNTKGPNSSPHFLTPGPRNFCVGHSYIWPQAVADSIDGDSIYYSFGNPLDGYCGDSPPISQCTFAAGYSVNQPVITGTGIYIHSNGNITFHTIQPEADVINIVYKEYRFDTVSNSWYHVGSMMRDMEISISSSCSNLGFSFDSPVDSASSNYNKYQILSCGDSILHFKATKPFTIASLDTDGSDFDILNSNNQLVPVIAAGVDSANAGAFEANYFWLKIYTPIYYNDTLRLTPRVGNDNNSLLSVCGDELSSNDTLYLVVDSCNSAMHLSELTNQNISIYPNPVKDNITVTIKNLNPDSYKLQIHDLRGKLLLQKNHLNYKNEIDLHDLPPGTFLIILDGKGPKQEKLFQKL